MIDEGEFCVISGGALLIVAISNFDYRAITLNFMGRLMRLARRNSTMN